jgi:AraC family transcriptional regulator of adaptative response/methylated-DNA-[protein]-cysteine methyltransferase
MATRLSETRDEDARWRAVRTRDASADGMFFYGVETTGVYCYPSCASRTPRREHVTFHATTADARRAGFRACKRCRPDEASPARRRADQIADLCRFIESHHSIPTLEELARHAGLSPFYVHRLFKDATGVTPRAYAAAHRARRVREGLASGARVTEAIYASGFNSNARFYASTDAMLGMTPRSYRSGGARETIRFAVGECSLGSILVAASARGVCAVLLGDDPERLVRDLERRFPRAALIGGDRDFESVVANVVGLVESPRTKTQLPLDVRGTAFQQRVWTALRAIPPGRTVTYSELAQSIGAPSSVRAVARACASNAIAVAIPCHRVVRRDGDLAGYRWGVERKKTLLAREKRRAPGDGGS